MTKDTPTADKEGLDATGLQEGLDIERERLRFA